MEEPKPTGEAAIDASLPTSASIPRGIQLVSLIDTRLEERLKGAGYQSWIYDQLQRERNELMALPTEENGIDLKRVYTFCTSMGMPLKALRFLTTWPPKLPDTPERGGLHDARHDITLVLRDEELEELNGPELSESLGIHELTHAWRTPEVQHAPFGLAQIAARLQDTEIPIYAFDRVLPMFWEESFAEWMRGQYVEKALGKPEGFGKGEHVSHMPDDPRVAKYTVQYKTPDKQIATSVYNVAYTYGALMLEELFARDPELQRLFMDVRTHKELLQEIQQRMEAPDMAPGLYESVRLFSPIVYGANSKTAAVWKHFFGQDTK